MPGATQLSINDATPTAHLFDPVAVSPNLTLYRNTTDAATSATEEQIGASLSRASGSRVTNKVKVTVSVPYEQTIDGAVITRSTARANIEFTLPDDMSASERDHFGAIVRNTLAHADIKGYYEDLIPVW